MTRPIVCHEGKCQDRDKGFLDECLDCDIIEEIEHQLLKDNMDR